MSGESSSYIGVTPNDQLQAEIFMLKMDHFEEVFDWLSLKDLVMLSKTCKRMQCIVRYYTKTNYTGIYPQYQDNSIYKDVEFSDELIKLNTLSSNLKKLLIHYLEYIRWDHRERKWDESSGTCIIGHMKADQFKSLTEILLKRVILTDDGISRIKEILGQLETVKLKFPRFMDENKEFYASFLQFCTSIQRLCIQGNASSIVGVDNSWLQRKYPTLKHLEVTKHVNEGVISELRTFFDQNKNIKSFATSVEDILANRNIFINTELKLDVLSIKYVLKSTFGTSRDFLNELHKRGLFRELHVYCFALYNSILNQNSVNQLASFNGLTKLFIEGMKIGTDLSPLINLKQLYIHRAWRVTNMDKLAKELKNLELVQFTFASVKDIVPFIRDSRKVNTIVVFSIKENDGNIFSIRKLNEERSKLINARKVTIYVQERVYLATKWSNNQTNSTLIELKRGASYGELNHCFDYMDYPDMKF